MKISFQKATITDFHMIQRFYWDVIDNIHRNNENLGWERGSSFRSFSIPLIVLPRPFQVLCKLKKLT